MTNTQEIPWKRLAVEAAAIVVSILLAFAIDAWWDDAQQQRRLQSVLIDLESAFSENVTMIDDNIEIVVRYQGILKRFIETESGDVARIAPELTFDIIQTIWRPVTTGNNNSMLIAMLDSESLASLEFPELQDAIADWRSQVDQINERIGVLVDGEPEALTALGHHPEVGLALARSDTGAQQLSGEVMRRLREDSDVMAIAAKKIFLDFRYLDALQANRDASKRVFRLIQEALD